MKLKSNIFAFIAGSVSNEFDFSRKQMKIKRKFELLTVVNRRYLIRQSAPGRQIACAECGEPMLTVEQAANIFSITQRRIFQIIETDAAHFAEAEAGATIVCLTSLSMVLDLNGN